MTDDAHTFDELVRRADASWDAGDYEAAGGLYRLAVETAPGSRRAFSALERFDECETILSGKEWYGDAFPEYHAAGILGALTVDDRRPYLHNVVFGREAYEAFHISLYLTDLLRIRRFPGLIQPSFLLLHLAMQAIGAPGVEFSEIGASVYAAFEKLKNAAAFAQAKSVDSRLPTIRHICVELSDRLRILAGALHADTPILLCPSWRHVPPPDAPRFAYSLGVGNYAFVNGTQLVEWIAQNHVTMLRERFTISGDFTHHIMGKRFIFFDLNAVAKELASRGYRLIYSIAESRPFIDSGEPLPTQSVFFDAHVFIHRMRDNELQLLATALKMCGADDLPGFWDAEPPAVMSSDALLSGRGLDELISEIEWKKNYVRTPIPEARLGDKRLDFSGSVIPKRFAAHLDILQRMYGGSMAQQVRDFGKGVAVSSAPTPLSAEGLLEKHPARSRAAPWFQFLRLLRKQD